MFLCGHARTCSTWTNKSTHIFHQSDFQRFCRYVLLKGVNDSLEDAERLGCMLKTVHCAVNLIMYNSHEGAPFKASAYQTALVFRDAVRALGKLCTIRESKVCRASHMISRADISTDVS